MNTPAFLTGSHAYGTPTDDSDVDFVIRVSDSVMLAALFLMRDADDPERPLSAGGDEPRSSYRFGNLNLIVCHTDRNYADWRDGTALLVARKPVTREEAIDVFETMRARLDSEVPTDAQTIARLRALAERWERNGVPHGEAILEILNDTPTRNTR